MVCSEPLISEDAPPQWKCICLAMYWVPSAAVMCMVGGRLICTGREDEGGLPQVHTGTEGSGVPARRLPRSPAHSWEDETTLA